MVNIWASVPPAPPNALSATLLVVTNLNWSAVPYADVGSPLYVPPPHPAAGAPPALPAGVEVVVVLARRFRPNWLRPRTPRAWAAIAVIVFAPEVRVGPLTVTLYP